MVLNTKTVDLISRGLYWHGKILAKLWDSTALLVFPGAGNVAWQLNGADHFHSSAHPELPK